MATTVEDGAGTGAVSDPGDGPSREHASVAKRAAAVLVDGVALASIVAAPTAWIFATYGTRTGTAGYQVTGGPALLLFAIWFLLWQAYHIGFEGLTATTPGKWLFNLEIVDEDGQEAGWKATLGRNLLRIVDGLLFYLVGAVAASTSERGQRYGDKMAGTLVVPR